MSPQSWLEIYCYVYFYSIYVFCLLELDKCAVAQKMQWGSYEFFLSIRSNTLGFFPFSFIYVTLSAFD
jgi:hypothetical protein